MLDNAKLVTEKAPTHLRQVIIVKDMTPKQREERRVRRRDRARGGEASGGEEMQNPNNTNSMETDPLSPIVGNANAQNQSLSQLNIHSSTSVFEESTIIDQHIGPHPFSDVTENEQTVIGGVEFDARSTTSTATSEY